MPHETDSKAPKPPDPIVRLGLVQWQMQPYGSLGELLGHAESLVEALAASKCDFALFPEFFGAPLMAEHHQLPATQAIRHLAEHTPAIVQKFSELAVAHHIHLITGSMPERVGEVLHNVGYLCRRDGTLERYEKLHVTPDEEEAWALKGGHALKTFDTDCGKIGILICYDVEFPELGRLLADEGMEILFVPFLTDNPHGFSRVRHCAQARAIENECYVAIAGCVGELFNVHNLDTHYARSSVFTPCDHAFPANGIMAEAAPDIETTLIADVNLKLLKELHDSGSVKNLKDRRADLYELKRKQ